MKILSIDPGFERMGVAVVEKKEDSNNPFVLYSTCVRTSPKDDFHRRLNILGRELEIVIGKYKPESLAIEKLFFSSNQKTALFVAEARGVAVYEAARNNLYVYEYTPLQIKAAVTGYGRASKEQVILMVQKLADFKEREKKTQTKKISDDEFDAIAVGITHFAHYNPLIYKKTTR